MAAAGVIFCATLLNGCKPGPSTAPTSLQERSAPPERETWEVSYIQKARVGYTHTTAHRLMRDGREVVRTESRSRLRVVRFDTPMETDILLVSLETPEGQLREFRSETGPNAASMATEGRVVGDEMQLKITTKDKTVATSIPWSAEYGGFFAADESLFRRPMKSGQRRTIRALVPLTNQVAATELVAGDYETVALLDGTRKLLRIDAATKLDNQTIREAIWCDPGGEIWKRRAEMLDTETYRTTQAVALGDGSPVDLDIVWKLSIPVDRVLVRPHQTKRVRYRVHLDGEDPAGAFVAGPTQQVRSIDPHTAEVTVFAVRPGRPSGNPDAKDEPPTDGDREPNNFIQSDNSKILEAARKAAGDSGDPWQIAVALERTARELIPKRGFTQAFASAAEVIESGEGDCTEHAVLLAAMARARGIPARAAIGLVYKDQTFLYHMWDELYVAGRWIPMDATLAQGGIGAAHLKLAHSNLQGASAFSSILPVAQVAGRLKIEILEAE